MTSRLGLTPMAINAAAARLAAINREAVAGLRDDEIGWAAQEILAAALPFISIKDAS